MSDIDILKTNFPNSDGNSLAGTPQKFTKSVKSLQFASSSGGISLSGFDKNEIGSNINVRPRQPLPKPPDEFFKELFLFHEKRNTPIVNMPRISGRVVDLHKLYSEVTDRGGFLKVNIRDEWDEIVPALGIREKCLNATAAIKQIYRRFLDKYERQTYFGEDPDKMEALEASDPLETGRTGRARYPSLHNSSNNSSLLNAVPMSYNHRQHIVNIERRRLNKMSTDLFKASPYEKLMLSLLSPLPNEQDFAINVCTLMSNESKHTLKLNEHPKLLDILLAHTGIFADYTLRKLFQCIYANVREHSLYSFWRDLLYDKPQVLELYTDEQALREAALLDPDVEMETLKLPITPKLEEYLSEDFFNLKRGEGTQDYIGQRVQQISAILRNLSFFDENLPVFAKNKTFLRFIVMASNIRWGNIHMQALDIAGNVATELELLDPTTDDLSRNLMSTLCDGIEGRDRAVILNCLEILYKISQKDSNEEFVNKCLNLKFYETICQFLSLNDIMLLIYTLEAIYSLSSTGARSCHLLMQVRGIVDQLVALITVEAQSYGPDGCILMRVVETVPGNMLPMVAQNIANLQNSIQNQTQQLNLTQLNPTATPILQANNLVQQTVAVQQQQQQQETTIQQPQNIVEQSIKADTLIKPQQQQTQITSTGSGTGTSAATTLQMPQNYTQEDEQYALAWLGATFERTGTNESHVEQQELYRMYLAHCQKHGKHSVVNHQQFPRLVRLIYNQSAGPVTIRGPDGIELPGLHYAGIKIRAQPLPIQGKCGQLGTQKPETPIPARRGKKKLKPQPIPQQEKSNDTNSSSSDSKIESIMQPIHAVATAATAAVTVENKIEQPSMIAEQTNATLNLNETINTIEEQQRNDGNQISVIMDANQQNQQQHQLQQQQPTTSLIKSLLANKVTQRQQKQKELIGIPNPNPSPNQQQIQSHQSTTVSAVKTSVVTSAPSISTAVEVSSSQPIKVASTAISALVNNTLMQHTPVKVGQTTIKPLNINQHIEKKPIIESTTPVPPLAPLSGNSFVKDSSGRQIIIASTAPPPPRLVEIIDKKTHIMDPSYIPATIIKRKLENETPPPPPLTSKRLALDETPVTPSKSAANLYAEIAASILEDEDMEEMSQPETSTQPPQQQQPQQQQQIVRIQQQPSPVVTLPTIQQSAPLSNPMQRQLLFQTTTPTLPQLKSTLTHAQPQQIPTAMATIKTDQGLQTVPVILQQKSLDNQQMHLTQQTTTTQYVLATNPQGQTYLVAQQTPTIAPTPPPPPPPSTQTVLVTQTPQQQSAGTKTIIILQQQSPHGGAPTQKIITTGGALTGQKMIMTTPQGQQVLVTQRPATAATTNATQQQIFINPQTGTATHVHVPTVVTSSLVAATTSTPTFQRQIIQTAVHQQQPQKQHAGQISPTLLSQLNQIPATIKLHQPQPTQTTPQQPQPATISRIGKPVLATVTGQPAQIQIPPLQQHQSIIQQHIVSGPTEKRQVILGGGRIEIKETIITQAQPTQQTQLNSQTIITSQQQQQPTTVMPVTPSIISQKVTDPPSLIPTTNIAKQQTVVQTIVPTAQPTLVSNIKKTSVPQVITGGVGQDMNQHQIKIQVSTTTPTITATKPLFTGNEPPPLTSVSTTTSMIVNQPQLQQQQEKSIETAINKNIINSVTTATTTQNQQQSESTVSSSTSISTMTTKIVAQTSLPSPSLPQPLAQPQSQQQQQPPMPHPSLPTVVIPSIDPNWLFICDWRNCPRRKFKSLNELQYHVIIVHCPDHLDSGAEIFCQWGAGAGVCDGVPRKRFSLMTHLIDRHLNTDALRAACQRRIAAGTVNVQPTQPPVTIMRNPDKAQQNNTQSSTTGSTTSSTSPSNTMGYSALHAIKRHTADFINAKELLDENEGPVTKSIRLTAALILRNLVTYTESAKRSLRRYEPHLASIALSNVESSGALSHILAELSE